MAAAATAVGGLVHGDANFAGVPADVRAAVIIVVLQVTMAAAFGALAAQTAVALVAYLQRLGTDVRTSQTPRDPATTNDSAPLSPDSLGVGTARPVGDRVGPTPDGPQN